MKCVQSLFLLCLMDVFSAVSKVTFKNQLLIQSSSEYCVSLYSLWHEIQKSRYQTLFTHISCVTQTGF